MQTLSLWQSLGLCEPCQSYFNMYTFTRLAKDCSTEHVKDACVHVECAPSRTAPLTVSQLVLQLLLLFGNKEATGQTVLESSPGSTSGQASYTVWGIYAVFLGKTQEGGRRETPLKLTLTHCIPLPFKLSEEKKFFVFDT
ncbi:hypothetical protein JOB18_025649 [Solea senegalensis]|uniref:Uncharacterized protein n=1 Tax=Solea senegalensis TaxID=28829 RepID=A0AAV6R5K9_SOLSE|nr:hypothetical protein JOB18_025649 [Solea senegalensis]